MSVTNDADGLGFSDSRSTYTPMTDNDDDTMRFAVALSKVDGG